MTLPSTPERAAVVCIRETPGCTIGEIVDYIVELKITNDNRASIYQAVVETIAYQLNKGYIKKSEVGVLSRFTLTKHGLRNLFTLDPKDSDLTPAGEVTVSRMVPTRYPSGPWQDKLTAALNALRVDPTNVKPVDQLCSRLGIVNKTAHRLIDTLKELRLYEEDGVGYAVDENTIRVTSEMLKGIDVGGKERSTQPS